MRLNNLIKRLGMAAGLALTAFNAMATELTVYTAIEAEDLKKYAGLAGAFEQKLTVSPSRTHLKP